MATPIIQIIRLPASDKTEASVFDGHEDLAEFLEAEMPLGQTTHAIFDCKNLTNNKQCTVQFWRLKMCICEQVDRFKDDPEGMKKHLCIRYNVQGKTNVAG